MLNLIKKIITKKLVKTVVRTVSKGNPYALAAVELYSLVDILVEKEDEGSLATGVRKDEGKIKTGIKQDKRKTRK